ncbi:MAG: EAL domain-containing protein [Xanthomonadales bacterium]|nr:EAL domain-containing protein [Xanthomonadales bacterium]
MPRRLTALAAALCAAVVLSWSGLTAGLDWAVLDHAGRPAAATDPAPVVLVAIDDASLARHGRWPWPRARVAALLEAVARAGARPIAIDLLLSERDDGNAAGDEALAAAMLRSGPVLLPVPATADADATTMAGRIGRLWPNARLVHSDVELGDDGVVRWLHRRVVRDGLALPAMAFALADPASARAVAEPEAPPVRSQGGDPTWLRSDTVVLSLGAELAQVDLWSASDVLEGRVPGSAFAGRPAVIGVTARGLGQSFLVAGPGAGRSTLAGAELTAAATAGLLGGRDSRLPGTGAAILAATLVALPLTALAVALPWRVLVPALPLLALLPLALAWLGRSLLAVNLGLAPASGAVLVAFLVLLMFRIPFDRRRLADTRAELDEALADRVQTVVALDPRGAVLFASDPGDPLVAALAGNEGSGIRTAGPDDVGAVLDLVAAVRRSGVAHSRRLSGRAGDGVDKGRVASVSAADFDGRPGFLLMLGNASAGEGQAAAEWLRDHDPVSGFPARRQLWSRLVGLASAADTAPGRELALVLVAIDGFRRINEALGEAEGDLALRHAAQALAGEFPAPGGLFRWDGDQFALLQAVSGSGPDDVETLARRACALFADGAVRHRGMVLRASVGAASVPGRMSGLRSLLPRAERALAEVKRTGGSQWLVDRGSPGWTVDQLEVERGIREGLEGGQFFLVYQRIVDAPSGRTVRLEALLRWRHPQRGVLAPGHFLDVAEAASLEIELGRRAIACVRRDAQALAGHGVRLPISLNVSARHFERPSFIDDMRPLAGSDGDCRFLVEITESLALRDPDRAARIACELAALGIGVSLDDLLSGHSSLALLRSMQVRELKLVGELVARVERDPEAAMLVRAIIELGRSLAMTVVAEGVETEEQSQWLVAAGCPVQQGYLFGRPVEWPQLVD